jgi:hypothetical protein
MLKRIITIIAVGCVAGANAGTQDKSIQVLKTLDTILSKAGISIGGEFKSQYFGANIGGEGSDSTKRFNETNEFTSVDFDIKAKPNDNVAGRVIFRMHQNWQNFYSDISNPIFTRWLSIDGGARDMFRFNVGDYRAKYSSLTLYTPEIDIMYEPYIFARQRQIAMDEMFIGNNDRLLQGFNGGFDAEIAPLFDEFHLGISAARLRSTASSIANGSNVANRWEIFDTVGAASKYFVGSNLDMRFLKGIDLGASWLVLFDHKGSFRIQNDTTIDTLAQFTSIVSARPRVDIAKYLSNDALTLKAGVETAFSLDDSTWFDTTAGFSDSAIMGKAIRGEIEAGYASGNLFDVNVNAAYVLNDGLFRNELAQSPAFMPSRIMNLENDNVDTLQHYTTFDALYHTVFKFCPIAGTSPNTAPIRWSKAPFMKNSWTRTVYSQSGLNALQTNGGLDPSIELVMPFGPATPNRQGITADLKGSFLKDAIEVKGLVSMLSEKDLDTVIRTSDSAKLEVPATSFSQMGGGLKVDVSKFIPGVLHYPLELSGSMVLSSAKNDGIGDTALHKPEWEITSSFLNAGLYWKFFKRAALVGGLQLINNSATIDTASSEQAQMHWAGGLEWKVSQGAEVVASYGQIVVDNDETNRSLLRSKWAVPTAKDFVQQLVDVSLRVKF